MEFKKSEIKLDAEGFNSMPGRGEVVAQLNSRLKDYVNDQPLWEAVDSERSYWQNAEDTLVITIPMTLDRGILLGLEIGKIVQETGADEVDWAVSTREGKVIIRIWWD